MLIPDNLLTLSTSEIENANLFPFPFSMHLIFCLISLAFFGWRFYTDKKPFQLIFAIAIPFSLAIWLNDSRTWFYILGAIELLLIVVSIITLFVFRKKKPEKSEEKADSAASGSTASEAPDNEEE